MGGLAHESRLAYITGEHDSQCVWLERSDACCSSHARLLYRIHSRTEDKHIWCPSEKTLIERRCSGTRVPTRVRTEQESRATGYPRVYSFLSTSLLMSALNHDACISCDVVHAHELCRIVSWCHLPCCRQRPHIGSSPFLLK